MIHDTKLLDSLSAFEPVIFAGDCFRATRRSLDPLTPSTRGGRWITPGYTSVLYTSCEREGALAEISFHWAMQTPLPTKPVVLHRIAVSAEKTMRLMRPDLESLGVDWNRFADVDYIVTQKIGGAVAFLECDGLIVPSARWGCNNVVIYTDNQKPNTHISKLDEEEVDWLAWAKANAFIE